MLRNTVRGVLGLVFVAAATWLANYVTEADLRSRRPGHECLNPRRPVTELRDSGEGRPIDARFAVIVSGASRLSADQVNAIA